LPKLPIAKWIGSAAKKVVGAIPIVGGVAQSVLNAQTNVQNRKTAGEPPAQAFINGVSDVIRPPLSGPAEQSVLKYALIGGGILLLVLLLRRR